MKKIKSIIIDDDEFIHWQLRDALAAHCPDVEVLASAGSATEGLSLIHRTNPDLVFLDIRLPDATGFDVLRAVSQASFSVVFITSHNEYAINALRFSALDYLLKPIDPVDLAQAIARFRQMNRPDSLRSQIETLRNNLKREEGDFQLHIAGRNGTTSLNIGEIVYCEGDSNYTHFHLQNGKKATATKTLKEFDALLIGHDFFRAHRKYLVNLNCARKILPDGRLELTNGDAIEVAKRRRTQLRDRLQTHSS